jgi:hypothetical protein
MFSVLHLDTLRHEVRILGPTLFAIPVAVVLAIATFTAMMFAGHVEHGFIANLLIGNLEALLPLVVGIILTAIAVQDSSLELLLTVGISYRRIAFRRFILIIGWTMLIEVIATLLLYAFLPWVLHKALLEGQLIWLGPTLWCSGVGIMGTLLLRSRITCVALFACIWIIELVIHGYFAHYSWLQPWFLPATLFNPDASFWLTNRIELIITALLLLTAAWFYLGNSEWRFNGEEDKS